MACHILFIFILTFSIISGSFVNTDVEDIRVTAKDSEIRVTGSFHLDILDKTRGKVLEKIRANLEVSSELVKTPNLSVKVELWCPNFNSVAFRLTPVTRVKRQDNTTKLYLDFPWRDEQCTKCFMCRHWNFTVIFKTNDKGVASLNKQAITIEKIKAYFQDAECEYNGGECLPWRTNASLDSFENCTNPFCNYVPHLKNQTSYMAATEDTKTKWISRDIYGSGSGCSMNIMMSAYYTAYVTVSMISSNGETPMLRRMFSFKDMNWTVVKIPVGRVDEVFRLTLCVHTLFIAAIQRIGLQNCNVVQETTGCSKDDFRCSTGKCIPRDKVCDLNPDCPLQDDEDKDFCKNQGYRHSCDVDRDNCSWAFDPLCPFSKRDVNVYYPDFMKHKEYCNIGEKDYVLFAQKCEKNAAPSLKSPVLQPFNSSRDCRVRLWYISDMYDTVQVMLCLNESNCVIVKNLTKWDSEPDWERVSVSVPHRYQPFEIKFQVVWSPSAHMVALDQITFTEDCFTKSDVWHDPLMEEVSTPDRVGGDSDYILTGVGVAAGVVLAVITALVIFSVFKKRRTFKSNGSCQNILPSSTASSGLDGKCSFPVDISDASSADSERQSLVPSNLAVSSISPYYEWTEDKIRDIPRKKIKLVKLLGKGAFGEVYYGLLADVSRLRKDLPIAVKKLITLCPEQTKAELFFEAITLSKFSHPNIVRFLGISTDSLDQSMYLLLELMEGGDLRTFIRESRPKQPHEPSYLTLHDLLKLGIDVSRGCHYLEQNKFIHRDIAARNCLLTEKGPNRVAKIGDFGMARDVLRTNYYRKNGRAMVPVKWMPPESFLDGIFTSKTDVWAYGVVLWELFTMGHVPYPGKSNDDVMKYVKGGGRLERTPLCPFPVYDLMMQCWYVDSEFRPNFSSIENELQRIYNEEELSSLITYEDIMGISSNTCDKEPVTSGSVTYATDIKSSNASVKLKSDSDNS
uniref:Uncharacterized protein LOC111105594 n=1 Tax=Crassostrea virginica TaxID=6565 RepID=A0A8B8AY48_CRAVI|nr:uncharacterized protein LOC111105594 [Crassostrea virginica]